MTALNRALYNVHQNGSPPDKHAIRVLVTLIGQIIGMLIVFTISSFHQLHFQCYMCTHQYTPYTKCKEHQRQLSSNLVQCYSDMLFDHFAVLSSHRIPYTSIGSCPVGYGALDIDHVLTLHHNNPNIWYGLSGHYRLLLERFKLVMFYHLIQPVQIKISLGFKRKFMILTALVYAYKTLISTSGHRAIAHLEQTQILTPFCGQIHNKQHRDKFLTIDTCTSNGIDNLPFFVIILQPFVTSLCENSRVQSVTHQSDSNWNLNDRMWTLRPLFYTTSSSAANDDNN